jgi:DNA polymerase-1
MLAFRNAAATERKIDWGEDPYEGEPAEPSYFADLDAAKGFVQHQLAQLTDKFNPRRIIIALSDTTNYRHKVLPSYKHTRVAKHEPTHLPALKAWIAESYDCLLFEDVEADDVLGILGSDPQKRRRRIVISNDKDLLTVPGEHFNPVKQVAHFITEDTGNRNWMKQTLTGDTCDGYTGCPGVGPVKAEAILKDAEVAFKAGLYETLLAAYWAFVEETFIKLGQTPEFALATARIARILRFEDWQEGKPVLWVPK